MGGYLRDELAAVRAEMCELSELSPAPQWQVKTSTRLLDSIFGATKADIQFGSDAMQTRHARGGKCAPYAP